MKFTFPPESRPLPGVTIKRAVHRGGFGEVYYGLTDAGKEVALKLLNQHTEIELRGARACLNLNHPHLVSIYDIKTDGDGDSWIIMEYVGGKRLADVLDDRQRLPVEEIEHWLEGITAGLTFLHDRGIVHRDLKPSNIFRENRVVKVGDVGLSKFISESRRSAHTQSVGTVYYMAPEVARGRYGREVDVYALAIMIFEMFTGDVPFDGESSAEILMKHLSERPNLQKLPEPLRQVLARALEKDPNKRTRTAAQLRDEFKAAVRGRPSAPPRFDEEPLWIDEPFFEDKPVANKAEAAEELREDSFIDHPRRENDDGRRDVQEWTSGRRHAKRERRYSHAQRAAVASAFGPGPHGCGSGRHGCRSQRRRRELLQNVHHAQGRRRGHGPCCGGLLAAIKARPWLIAVGLGGFLLLTRPGRALLPELMGFSIVGAVIAAYVFLGIVLVRYFTDASRRTATARADSPSTIGPPPAQAGAPQYVAAPRVRRGKREIPTPATRRKISAWNRASQLTGSWTIAALVTALLTAGLSFWGVFAKAPVSGAFRIESSLFFGGTVLLGSWLMLAMAKLLEGTGTSGAARRLLQAGAGAVTGACAWSLNEYLFFGSPAFDLPPRSEAALFRQIGSLDLVVGQQPSVWGYIIFFAALMFMAQWWLGSDSYRAKRFSVWRTLLVAFMGYVASVLFPMPTMWGVLWALVTYSVVQLASTWTPPEERVAKGTVV